MPVDDRVRAPLPYEARPADGSVDGVRGGLLGVVEPDLAPLAVRVVVVRLPPLLALRGRPAPDELGKEHRPLFREFNWFRQHGE